MATKGLLFRELPGEDLDFVRELKETLVRRWQESITDTSTYGTRWVSQELPQWFGITEAEVQRLVKVRRKLRPTGQADFWAMNSDESLPVWMRQARYKDPDEAMRHLLIVALDELRRSRRCVRVDTIVCDARFGLERLVLLVMAMDDMGV